MATTAEFAKELAEAGYAVFPVNQDKVPLTANGLKDATLDPFYAQELFEKHPTSLVAIHAGRSGLVVLDVDYKEEDGVVVKDGFERIAEEWLEVPETFSYTSTGGAGVHYLYRAPEGVNLPPKADYRGLKGIDRRSGESYIVFNSDSIPTGLAEPPEWFLDNTGVRSAAAFEGDVKDWYETLEPGAPNLLVRSAMERAQEQYDKNGQDFSHSDLVERQHEAVRLGAEGNPGVPEYLAMLEDLTLNRTGSHSRTPDEYAYEFAEALASGIKKHGASIQLRAEVPEYDLRLVPDAVPSSLVSGDPGDKNDFSRLLRELQASTDDDLTVTGVLWGSPKTRDIAHEWGLEFVHQRVLDARVKPEPVRENPTLKDPDRTPKKDAPEPEKTKKDGFLSKAEAKLVKKTRTFISDYLDASAQKGFGVPAYDVPGAWTALSMAVGTSAVTAFNGVGVNLWFIEMGGTGTGKTSSQKFLRAVLDLILRTGDGYWNVGASSSPAAIHEELLVRDGKSSMVMHDEAASFFSDLHNSDWMKTLEHHFSAFYDGEVEPSNKIRLPQELRGKHAKTSFNLNMSATPDKLLSLITSSMFESGFLSRVNWTWAPNRPDDDERFQMRPSEIDASTRTHPAAFDLGGDLKHLSQAFSETIVVNGTDEAWERMSQAFKDFDTAAREEERYEVLQGPLARLSETMVKCAALLALYRGRKSFSLEDAVIAISYAADWFETTCRVVSETSESEFSRGVSDIEQYIRENAGEVTEAKLNHRFRMIIRKSPRELSDRIDFLRVSGRINRVEKDKSVSYVLNGSD